MILRANLFFFLGFFDLECIHVFEVRLGGGGHQTHAHVVCGGASPPEQRPGVVGSVAADERTLSKEKKFLPDERNML